MSVMQVVSQSACEQSSHEYVLHLFGVEGCGLGAGYTLGRAGLSVVIILLLGHKAI